VFLKNVVLQVGPRRRKNCGISVPAILGVGKRRHGNNEMPCVNKLAAKPTGRDKWVNFIPFRSEVIDKSESDCEIYCYPTLFLLSLLNTDFYVCVM